MTFGSTGAVVSLLPVRILEIILEIANPAMPRNDSTRTTSWCRRPLPPLTRPRSRIRQCCPLLIRASLIFAKRDIARSMHCQVSASILDKTIPVLLVRILIRAAPIARLSAAAASHYSAGIWHQGRSARRSVDEGVARRVRGAVRCGGHAAGSAVQGSDSHTRCHAGRG